jgi:hypothetical protein
MLILPTSFDLDGKLSAALCISVIKSEGGVGAVRNLLKIEEFAENTFPQLLFIAAIPYIRRIYGMACNAPGDCQMWMCSLWLWAAWCLATQGQ